MRWLIVAVLGVLLLGALGWRLAPRIASLLPSREIKLARRELPGAALQFPAGKVLQENLDYEMGKLEVQLPGRGRATVDWATDSDMTPDELEAVMVRPLVASLGVSIAARTEITAAGKQGTRWLLAGKGIEMALSDWPCGKRTFNLLVGASKDTTTLEQRMRDSFECTPDPARDGVQRAIAVELNPGQDYGTVTENPLTVVSLDGEIVVVAPYKTAEALDAAKFDEFVPRLMDGIATASGVTGTSFVSTMVQRGATRQKVWRGTGDMDGERRLVLSTVVDCGAEKFLSLYMGDPKKPDSSGLDVLFGARCTKSPKRAPPFDEVALKACARGDKRACPERQQK